VDGDIYDGIILVFNKLSKVNGEKIKLTATVYILILMELAMKVVGGMIFKMDMELRLGIEYKIIEFIG